MYAGKARYSVGDTIQHKLFAYRGVIIDVDPTFQQSAVWYDVMATSNPLKNQPWYHILVDDTDFTTYVAEQNLVPDTSSEPIEHPEIKKHFRTGKDAHYVTRRRIN